jgi:hypothetical protein
MQLGFMNVMLLYVMLLYVMLLYVMLLHVMLLHVMLLYLMLLYVMLLHVMLLYVMLLHSDHWHVSATQVAIFSVLSVTSEKSTVQIIPSLNNLEYNLPYILPMHTTPQNHNTDNHF